LPSGKKALFSEALFPVYLGWNLLVFTFLQCQAFAQGSKKVPSGHPKQVNFPAGQVTSHSHLPNEKEPRQVLSTKYFF